MIRDKYLFWITTNKTYKTGRISGAILFMTAIFNKLLILSSDYWRSNTINCRIKNYYKFYKEFQKRNISLYTQQRTFVIFVKCINMAMYQKMNMININSEKWVLGY